MRTIVSPGSSTMMCRGIASLVTSSNTPCSRSLYVMLSSSRIVTFGSAAWTSSMAEKVSAVSDSMPIPPAMGAAPNASNRRIDRETTGLCHPAGHESEGPSGHPEQGRMRGAVGVADEFVQRNARAGEQVEHSAVDEANSDPPVGCGLDHVALANRIADHDLNGNAARSPEGAATVRRLNIADDLGKQGRNGLTVVSRLDAGRNEHGFDLAC